MTASWIRAVSYNLRSYGKSSHSTRRDQHVLLRSLRPDVVCLQEIYSRDETLTEIAQLVGDIADALSMEHLAVPARHSNCHLAILWRPEYQVLSQRAYDLLLWHSLGVVRLDIGADAPLTVAVTHLGPWDPDKQLRDTYTLIGKLPLSQATILGADWNSFGADPAYDPEPDWSSLPAEWIERHIRWDDDPHTPPVADRRPAQLMQRSGFHDAAPTLGVPWTATGVHCGGWSRREDVFWTTRPTALRRYRVVDTPAGRPCPDLSEHDKDPQCIDPRELSDHLPIMIELDPQALTDPTPATGNERQPPVEEANS